MLTLTACSNESEYDLSTVNLPQEPTGLWKAYQNGWWIFELNADSTALVTLKQKDNYDNDFVTFRQKTIWEKNDDGTFNVGSFHGYTVLTDIINVRPYNTSGFLNKFIFKNWPEAGLMLQKVRYGERGADDPEYEVNNKELTAAVVGTWKGGTLKGEQGVQTVFYGDMTATETVSSSTTSPATYNRTWRTVGKTLYVLSEKGDTVHSGEYVGGDIMNLGNKGIPVIMERATAP